MRKRRNKLVIFSKGNPQTLFWGVTSMRKPDNYYYKDGRPSLTLSRARELRGVFPFLFLNVDLSLIILS